MTCHNCRTECRKFGKRKNRQRYQCTQCGKVFTDARDNTLEGMYLPKEKAETILRAILEGNSVSSVARLFELHPSTILKLMLIAGEKSERVNGSEDSQCSGPRRGAGRGMGVHRKEAKARAPRG